MKIEKGVRAVLASCALLASLGAEASYAEREEVQEFISGMVKRHKFAEKELKRVFAKAQRAQPVLDAIARPAERTRTWEEYRTLLVTERRIAEGVEFWKKYPRTLERAEKKYGVPPEYIVAIIGVETSYGRNTGNWRVVDALSTLAFDYPPRAGFFRSELEHYLLMARDAGWDVLSVRGSYAGAIGIPQFMPSSARAYAVDFDGNGKIDLQRSRSDSIGSVGNFLKKHGWEADADVLLPARLANEAARSFATGRLEPRHSLTELREAGVEFSSPNPPGASAALIELSNGPDRPSEYRVGLRNFYVITRYNRSALYATAVADLAAELRRAYDLGK